MLGINLDPLKPLLQNQGVRYVLVLLAGITIGAVFYPTKNVESKVSQKYEQQIKTLNEAHSQELQATHNELDKVTSESKNLQSQYQSQISQLTTQVHNLQSSKKVVYTKVIHPDGTVEIKQTSDTQTAETDNITTKLEAEYQQKLTEATQQLEKTHQDEIATLSKDYTSKAEAYEQTIAELKKDKTIETNPKKFGLEGGYLNDKDYYVHATGDLWGPVFVGVHGEAGVDGSKLGVGLGIRF